MGLYRTVTPPAAQASGWAGAPLARFPSRLERHFMDSAHGRPMGGAAGPLSAVSDLSSALATMAASGSHGAGRGSLGPGFRTAGEA